LFVFSKVPFVGFVVNSDEKFRVVHSGFSVSEWFSFVSIRFYSFVEEFGQYQVPIRCVGGSVFLVVQEEVIISEFEYRWKSRWGYSREVVLEVIYLLHQRWFVPISNVLVKSGGVVCGGMLHP
jgi:hypothetical protein